MFMRINRRTLFYTLYSIPFIFILLLAVHSGPDFDFKVFYSAGKAVLHGNKPLLWNPPWIALIFVPFALLPIQVSYPLYVGLSIVGLAVALYRLGCKPDNILAIMLSALGFMIVGNGNIDWLVLLGATIPPPIGLFLLIAKPQIGIMVVVILLIKALQQLRFANLRPILEFVPVSVAVLIAFALNLWNTPHIELLGNTLSSLFPNGIPIGVYLAYRSWKESRTDLALAASPFMVPYANPYSLIVWLIPLKENQRLLVLVSILTWAFVLFRLTTG